MRARALFRAGAQHASWAVGSPTRSSAPPPRRHRFADVEDASERAAPPARRAPSPGRLMGLRSRSCDERRRQRSGARWCRYRRDVSGGGELGEGDGRKVRRAGRATTRRARGARACLSGATMMAMAAGAISAYSARTVAGAAGTMIDDKSSHPRRPGAITFRLVPWALAGTGPPGVHCGMTISPRFGRRRDPVGRTRSVAPTVGTDATVAISLALRSG